MAKYSRMTADELMQEWEFWVSSSQGWEQTQALARNAGIKEPFDLCAEAIADNQATIDLLEEMMLDRQ